MLPGVFFFLISWLCLEEGHVLEHTKSYKQNPFFLGRRLEKEASEWEWGKISPFFSFFFPTDFAPRPVLRLEGHYSGRQQNQEKRPTGSKEGMLFFFSFFTCDISPQGELCDSLGEGGQPQKPTLSNLRTGKKWPLAAIGQGKILERPREGDPLTLWMNWHKTHTHPQAVHEWNRLREA